jgi:hypothetical protein
LIAEDRKACQYSGGGKVITAIKQNWMVGVIAMAGVLLVPASPDQRAPAGGAQKPAYTVFARAQPLPAINNPVFLPADQADRVMKPDEPVIGLRFGTEARAYSLWQLERNIVVNDRIAGRAIVVVWCPFSHIGVVYDRAPGGRELTLASDGRLLLGVMVLRDAETGSTWTVADGKAVDGASAGTTFVPLAALQTTWKVWKQEQPATVVLDKGGAAITGSSYTEYEADPRKFGTGSGVELKEPRMGGKNLVVGIVAGSDRVAIPLERVKRDLIVSTVVDRQAVAAVYDPSSDTVRVVRREARGNTVTLRRGFGDIYGAPTPPHLVDEGTASRWDLTGKAISGKMRDHRLPIFPYRVQYWYSWQAYFSRSRVE